MIQDSDTSLKVLDYLASSLPFISTEFDMKVYEDLKEYVKLSDQENFTKTLKSNTHFPEEVENVMVKYTWRAIVKTVYHVFISLLDKKDSLHQ